MTQYEYGAMSTKYSLQAENKLTAYATIVFHYYKSPHLVVIYEPKESDQWFDIQGKINDRLDEIFGGKGAFELYAADHMTEIRECYKTIKRIV